MADFDILFRAQIESSGAVKGLQELTQKARELETASGGTGQAVEATSNKVLELAKAVVGAYAINELVGFLKDCAAAAIEANKEQARLEAVLRATGGTAGFTGQQLAEYASELQDATGINEEAIKRSMAVLATFRSVSGDVFKEATALALDLSAVFGQDVASAATMLGKALEDPITGLSALRRVGVTFTEEAQEQIRVLIEQGKLFEAQKLILEGVAVQVRGVAQSVAEADGGFEALKNATDDAKEALGGIVLEAVKATGVVSALTSVMTFLRDSLEILAKGEKEYSWSANLTAKAIEGLIQKRQQQLEAVKAEMATLPRDSDAYAELRDKAASLQMEIKQLTGELGKKKEEEAKAKAVQDEYIRGLQNASESAKEAKRKQEELKQSLQQLKDELRPAEKAATDFANKIKLLKDAEHAGIIKTDEFEGLLAELAVTSRGSEGALDGLKKAMDSGLITTAQYNVLLGVLTKKEEEVKGVTPQVSGEMENMQDVLRELHSETNGAVVALDTLHDTAEEVWGTPPPPPNWSQEISEFKRMIQEAAAGGLTDGILGTLSGDDFQEAFAGVWEGLANIAAARLDAAFGTLLKGGSFQEAMKAAGLVDERGKIQLAQVGQMLGSLMLQYGVQQKNRTMGVVGGAMTGASIGAAFSGIGAGIGAVIGAIYGYFASAEKKYGFKFSYKGGKGFLDATGPTEEQEQEMLRQFRSTYMGYRSGFLAIFRALGEVPREALEALRDVTIEVQGKVTDVGGAWRQLLAGTLPRAMLANVGPIIEQSLSALGVSAERAKEQLAALTEGDFNAELQKFAAWLESVVGLAKMSELLGEDLDTVREKVNATMRETYLQGLEEVTERARQLTANLDVMFSEDQVANAQELLQISQRQYEATLEYIAGIEQISRGISDSVEQAFAGFEEQRAREAGPQALAQFYQQQMEALQQAMQSATSPEQLQQMWQQFMTYATRLWGLNLGDNDQANFAYREWVEQQIKATEGVTQKQLQQWEEEALKRQQELKSEVDKLKEALSTSTGSLGAQTEAVNQLTEGVEEEAQARERLRELMRGEAEAREASLQALSSFESMAVAAAQAAADAALALNALATAAENIPTLGAPQREVT